MKKLLSAALSAAMLAGMLASCQSPSPKFSPKISVTSSEAEEYATWLTDRLGNLPEKLTLGTGDSAGIDMTEFEDDGYVIRSREDETVISGKTDEGLDLAVRKYAKFASNGVGCEDTVYHEGYRIEKLTIADVDISNYTIFYSPNANDNMRFAVAELQQLVKKACGTELDAIQGDAVGDYTVEFKHSDDPELKNDGYRYSVDGTHLTFEGAVKRGCMYAVWRFLQNECGWDGLIYGDSVLAEAEHINIPDGLEKSETPAFEYLYIHGNFGEKFKSDRKDPNMWQNSYGTVTHACHGLVWYCDFTGGVDGEQICYTSEERYTECRDNVRRYIEDKKTSGLIPGYSLKDIDIAQGDNDNFCMCENCRRVFDEEGGNAGAMVRFANRLAEEMNGEYPGIMYKIFAYMSTRPAPKVTVPNEYVHVTFCMDGNCTKHRLDSSDCVRTEGYDREPNEVYTEWLRSWCDLTDNVYIWFYALDTSLQQYSVITNSYYDFKYFHDIGISGVFWQCTYHWFGIQRIEHKLITELNWNMDMTEEEYEELLCEFLEFDYGDGWNDIRSYISIWEQSQEMAPCWHCWSWMWTYCDVPRYDTKYYGDNFAKSVELIENAVRLANSKRQEMYAELFSCHIYYSGCYSLYFAAEDSGDRATIKKLTDYYDKMMGILYKYGFDPVSTGLTTVDGYKLKYSQRLVGAALFDWKYCRDYLSYHEFWVENPYYSE